MPLLKGTAGKAMPDMAIGYITRKDKAKYIDVQNLFIDEDYSAQFKETAARFGRYTEYNERKYYHFKLSPDRADHADPFMVQEYAKAYAEKAFPDCECVIATHTDTKTVHAHIVVNAVHPLTGRKLRFTESKYTKLKDMANEIGRKFRLSALDFRKNAQNKRTAEETHIILKGGTSWKEDLREVIEEGKRTATSECEFIAHLAKYGVSVTRSKTEYSYLHPEKKKAIRGLKLGQNYTKSEVLNVIEKHGNRTNGNTAYDVAGNERTGQTTYQNRFAQRSVVISNEKCNKLIETQNKLIEEMRADMAVTEYDLTTTVDKAVREIKTETAKTEKLNESIGIQVKKAVSTSVNDMKAEMIINVRETLSKTQEEIRKTEKEMEQLRENIRFESGVRKFLLWLTPALLVVQTIVLAISLL